MSAPWTCVECGLPDPYDGQGDGIGSCECPRCGCGLECLYCADVFDAHACGTDNDDDGLDPYDFATQDDDLVPHGRSVETVEMTGEVL